MHVDTFDSIKKSIIENEGFSSTLYKCPEGFNTIGYGFNLDSDGIPPEIADVWLNFLIFKIKKHLDFSIPWWTELNKARQLVLVDMAYNLGVGGLLSFKKMLRALGNGKYGLAAKEMQDSKWYRQVKGRAKKLVDIMKTGDL